MTSKSANVKKSPKSANDVARDKFLLETSTAPDAALIRGPVNVGRLVGVSRWTVTNWWKEVDSAGRCAHPVGRLFVEDDGEICIILGDWRKHLRKLRKEARKARA